MKFALSLLLAACVGVMASDLAERREMTIGDAAEKLEANPKAASTVVNSDRNVMESFDSDGRVIDSVDLDPSDVKRMASSARRVGGLESRSTPPRRADALFRRGDACNETGCGASGGGGDDNQCKDMIAPKCSGCVGITVPNTIYVAYVCYI